MEEVKTVAKATFALLGAMMVVIKITDHFWKDPSMAGEGNRGRGR